MSGIPRRLFETDPSEFAPGLARIEAVAPSPLGRAVLHAALALVAAALAWATLAQLDIVAVAEGKLVPAGYLKIVQPAEAGVVREILVREGDAVRADQLLARMDAMASEADARALGADYAARRLALRRIAAELAGRTLQRDAEDPPQAFAQAEAQRVANVHAQRNALAQEQSVLERARQDLAATAEVKAKLAQILPHYRAQEAAYARLAREGFAGQLMLADKERERIEKERDLHTQEFLIAGARATIAQAERRLAQIAADYRRRLEAERAEIAPQTERLREELAKHAHRRTLLELRAPQAGVIKDLATHTPGTVAAPGTILMTLVPADEPLRAEVWLTNDDVGFVRSGQAVKLKLATYPFQKYGMANGRVAQVSADATESNGPGTRARALAFRALVDLDTQHLESDGRRLALAAGMQLVAEVHLGERTVFEYLLSPVRRAFHEAGRER